MNLKIGEKIKQLSRRDGRTQEQLADALGITFQAVSRWESSLAYPDIEFIPSIANYFGVSIDELFGYVGEREKIVSELVSKINEKNKVNNGVDVCIDECIAMAREALAEFPGNEMLLHCLAGLLYNAGYAKYGEQHKTDGDGYDIFDTERHCKYAEWKEAKVIYEGLVSSLSDSKMKQDAVIQLTQLYAVTGETEKTEALISSLPDIYCSRDLLAVNAYDGKRRAEEYEKAFAKMLRVCASLLNSTVKSNDNFTNNEAIKRIKNAILILELDHTDSSDCHYENAGLNLYLSTFLWREGRFNEAFEVLDRAFDLSRHCSKKFTNELYTYWPMWCCPDYSDVEREIKADPRWDAWVKKCREA